jgi:hypothetical protein
MRAVVTGMIATYPVGGVVWDYGQYLLGLERLGFDVYYLEDTGWQTYDPARKAYGEEEAYGVRFLQRSLANLSPFLADRWHFRAMDGKTHGIDSATMAEIVAGADLFLNVSGGSLLREEYMPCKRKVLIDTDPGWNHFVNFPKWDRHPGWQGSRGYRAHDHFFTYAERIGQPDCALPGLGIPWQPTRPVVVPECWRPAPPGSRWTTVMTWNNFREPIEHDGMTYGSKEREFWRVEGIPSRVSASFEVAVGGSEIPRNRWRDLGWSVIDSHSISETAEAYRAYIQSSRGELSVAKNVYAATRSGWFSCRSICYLAAGRPVVLQDTGFSERVPTGEGLFAFSTPEQALQAIASIEADYSRHQAAAEEIARLHFDSKRVLCDLLTRIGLG